MEIFNKFTNEMWLQLFGIGFAIIVFCSIVVMIEAFSISNKLTEINKNAKKFENAVSDKIIATPINDTSKNN